MHNNERGGETLMKKNTNSQNFKQNNLREEFGEETNVLEVKQQNNKAQQK